ncbi:exodeoxyribonuclease V subunit alpha [Myxococcota bacterium]|nr:exodeoxyribonuclease V subunit alpha [Myxococcota bacterium]
MASDLLQPLVDGGILEPLDRALVRRALQRIGTTPDDHPAWAFPLALALRAPRLGHTHLRIDEEFPRHPREVLEEGLEDRVPGADSTCLPEWPDPRTWAEELSRCPLVRVFPELGDPLPEGPQASPEGPRALWVLVRGDREARLYLERHWDAERRFLRQVADRLAAGPGSGPEEAVGPGLAVRPEDLPAIREDLEVLLPIGDPEGAGGVLDQRLALIQGLSTPFLVLTGGPGTGKTTTVASFLALCFRQARRLGLPGDPPIQVRAMAPTGKAAARMTEAIRGQVGDLRERMADRPASVREDWEDVLRWMSVEAGTVHRMLRWSPREETFLHGPEHPLLADLVIVDEVSMMDLVLTVRLLDALPPGCRVLLVGDRDQLASVQAGSVLGDLCRAGRPLDFGVGPDLRRLARSLLPGEPSRLRLGSPPAGPLPDAVAVLRHSFRTGSDRNPLTRFIRQVQDLDDRASREALLSDTRALVSELPPWPESTGQPGPADEPGIWRIEAEETLAGLRGISPAGRGRSAWSREMRELATSRWAAILEPALDAVNTATGEPAWSRAAAAALRSLQGFMILCSHRQGPRGSEECNRIVRETLRARGLRGDGPWLAGQPVLVTENDYTTGLFNGDLGIVLPAPSGDSSGPVACFAGGPDQGIRTFPPTRVPGLVPAFALTVHKAQGSEFDEVLFVGPLQDDPFLTREMIYTALTRARRRVWLASTREAVAGALARRTRRDSGILAVLWPEA